MNDLVPDLAASGPLRDLWVGLTLPVRAARLLLTTPKLFSFTVVCALVTAVTLFGVGYFSWHGAGSLAEYLVGEGGALRQAALYSLAVLLFAAFFVSGSLTAPLLVLAPLTDPISEATETRLGDFTAPPFGLARLGKGVFESVAHTLLRLVLMLLGYLVLAPLHLVPGAGSVLWYIGSSLWATFWISAEHLSNPMARHLYKFREVVKALRARKLLALGFGGALYVLLWVPVLNFFLMPVAVVAGTLLYRALLKAGVLNRPT